MSRAQDTEFNIVLDDTTTADVTYIGFYNPEADYGTSRTIFQIFIIDERSGFHKYYAENSRKFNKIWDNRVSYLK